MLNTKIPCDCLNWIMLVIPVPSYIFPQNSGPRLALAMEDQLQVQWSLLVSLVPSLLGTRLLIKTINATIDTLAPGNIWRGNTANSRHNFSQLSVMSVVPQNCQTCVYNLDIWCNVPGALGRLGVVLPSVPLPSWLGFSISSKSFSNPLVGSSWTLNFGLW